MNTYYDAVAARATGMPVRRFKYECVESCHQGTDDAREFERHLTECNRIFPEICTLAKKWVREGRAVVAEPRRIRAERSGQIDLFAAGEVAQP